MSDEIPDPELQPWIDPELEARVVAWVVGEASEFEAAELERLAEEKPELGIFKRRIAAVHGLVGVASKPDAAPMRMSDERRGKLLEALGAGGGAAGVVAMPNGGARGGQRRSLYRAVLGIAAALVIAALILSISGLAQKKAPLSGAAALVQEQWVRQRELTKSGVGLVRLKDDVPEANKDRETFKAPASALAIWRGGVGGNGRLAALDSLKSQAEGSVSGNNTYAGATEISGGTLVVTTKSGQTVRQRLAGAMPGGGGGAGGDAASAARVKEKAKGASDMGLYAGTPLDENAVNAEGRLADVPALTTAPAAAAAFGSTDAASAEAPADLAAPRQQVAALAAPAQQIAPGAVPAFKYAQAQKDEATASAQGGAPASSDADTRTLDVDSVASIPIPATAAPGARGFISGNSGFGGGGGSAGGGVSRNTRSADKAIERALAPGGPATDGLFAKAKADEQAGRYDKAYQSYDKILNVDPYNISARKAQEAINARRDSHGGQAYSETRSQLLWEVESGWQMPAHKYGAVGGAAKTATADKNAPQSAAPAVVSGDARNQAKAAADAGMDFYKKTADAVNRLNDEIHKPGISAEEKAEKTAERDAAVADTKEIEREIGLFKQTREKPVMLGDIPLLGRAYRSTHATSSANATGVPGLNVPTMGYLFGNKLPAPPPVAVIPPIGEVSASEQAYSTFSLHVSDASFQLAREALTPVRPKTQATASIYRSIDVIVHRPGLKIIAKDGYYALPVAAR